MSMIERIQQDMTNALRARDENRLSTLRMVKAALMNKQIERKPSPLTDQDAIQVLSTMIKQRKDSIEQFTKGGRPELAQKEAVEISVIESYLPKAAGEDEIRAVVRATIAEMGSPTLKDIGTVMKNTMAKFQSQGARVDGKVVSDLVKQELSSRS